MGQERHHRPSDRVIRITDQDRNLRLVDKMAETVLGYEKARSSACAIADEWLNKVEKQNPQLTFSVQIMRSSLEYVQSDTIGELSSAYKIYQQTDVPLTSTRNQLRVVRDFSHLQNDDRGRFTLALLTANLFNREDEKIETALQRSAPNSSSPSSDIVSKVLQKGSATIIKSEHGNVKISPHDYLLHLSRLIHHEGLDEKHFQNYVDTIIQAQIRGLSMLETDYSSTDAAVYKLSTVGVYHRLVGNLFFRQYEQTDKYRHYLMGYQLGDDVDDIREDITIQPNPFVALLRRHNMLDEFIQSDMSFNKFLKREKDSISPETAIRFYQELRDFEAVYYSRDYSLVQTFLKN